MRRPDWTPIVLITASLSVTVVVAVFLTSPYLSSLFRTQPGPTVPRHALAPKIDVWVGEIEPGLVAVLGPVWGEAGPDAAHDARLNEELALPEGTDFGWYQLLVFNVGKEERRLTLPDGALRIRVKREADAEGAGAAAGAVDAVSFRSLAPLIARGEASPSPGLATVLRARGTLGESVTIPAGWMADLLVPFDRRVALDRALEVASATGSTFRRRPMERRKLEALVEDPSHALVEDL